MTFGIDDPEVEAEAKAMLRETLEHAGWFPGLRPEERAERIETDVEQMWRLMAEAARKRLEKVSMQTGGQGHEPYNDRNVQQLRSAAG